MSRSQNELGLSLVFLDGEGDHLLFVSCLQKSWRKMSTSTQDKTNTSLPLPQERNSYTSTPYLVLTASMARKKWPQGWLTHPILLVKVCYRLSYFEEIIKGWGKCLAINDFHKTGSWCQDGLATEMTRFESILL